MYFINGSLEVFSFSFWKWRISEKSLLLLRKCRLKTECHDWSNFNLSCLITSMMYHVKCSVYLNMLFSRWKKESRCLVKYCLKQIYNFLFLIVLCYTEIITLQQKLLIDTSFSKAFLYCGCERGNINTIYQMLRFTRSTF